MNWLILLLAGLVEVAWSQSIKPTANFTRPIPTIISLVLMVAAVFLLSQAMNTIPVGTAYAVFTGIGAVGAIGLGIWLNDDPVSVGRMVALAMIVGGIVLAKLTS
ncbi:DMT family transporter [Thermoactinospora rubra]|uniref:DMT family transporter n=1 Tax=Thermoactinospora rubra TaxID=1088767 RepID=UPI000A117B9E|nr:multidrug efflux SMR transporter [Thermoactinospora rubra]